MRDKRFRCDALTLCGSDALVGWLVAATTCLVVLYRNKNLPPPTDADFLLTVKEDIRIWTDCVKEYGQLHCLKVRGLKGRGALWRDIRCYRHSAWHGT